MDLFAYLAAIACNDEIEEVCFFAGAVFSPIG